MASRWFCRILGEELGPLTFPELAEMVRAGKLSEKDSVRADYQQEWQRAETVVGLFYMARRGPEKAKAAVEPVSETSTGAGELFPTVDEYLTRLGERPRVADDRGVAKGAWFWLRRTAGSPTENEPAVDNEKPSFEKTVLEETFSERHGVHPLQEEIDDRQAAGGAREIGFAFDGQSESETAAQSAARVLAPEMQVLRTDDQEVGRGSAAFAVLARSVRGGTEFVSDLAGSLADAAANPGRVGKFVVGVAVLAVIGLSVWWGMNVTADMRALRNESVYGRLSAALQEVESLQARGTAGDEWNTFRQQTLEWLVPLVDGLEKSARRNPILTGESGGADRRAALARRQLLFASRRFLAMLNRRELTEDGVQELAALMETAQGYLAATPTGPGIVETPKRVRRAASTPTRWGVFEIGMLSVDALLIGGGLVWWVRRRRAVAA